MCPHFEMSTLNVLTVLMANQECIADIVGMGVVPALLVVSANASPTNTGVILAALGCLNMVVSHPQVVKEAIQKGENLGYFSFLFDNFVSNVFFSSLILSSNFGCVTPFGVNEFSSVMIISIRVWFYFLGTILYLLDFFCRRNIDPMIRQKASEVLSKLCADKLSGPRVKILLSKFLPSIFCEAMAESPQSAVHLFDSDTENPEIVWNANTISNVTTAIQSMKHELFMAQKRDLSVDWRLPSESFQVDYNVADELTIGGIYLRLYVTNPSWNLRKPREFLRDLLEFALSPSASGHKKSADSLDLVGSAIGHLLASQPHMCDALPSMGYLSPILAAMESDRAELKRMSAIILRHISNNHACIEALCHMKSIQCIVNGLNKRFDMLPVTCEALNHLFGARHSELVAQALECNLIPLLLKILKHGGGDLGPSPASTVANIVHALQAMAQDEKYGQEVETILAASEIWPQYRDQVINSVCSHET